MMRDITIQNRVAFCNFCHEACNKGGAIPSEDDSLTMYRWWHCDNCRVSFLVFQDTVNTLELRTSLNKHFYIVKVNIYLGYTEVFVWKDKPIDLSGDELIVKIDSILDVTPKTLPNKLKSILTFL